MLGTRLKGIQSKISLKKCILAIKVLSSNFLLLYILSHCAAWLSNLNITSIAQDMLS